MLAKLTIERSAGLLLLLITSGILLMLTVGRFGIGAERPYFLEDFAALAHNPDRFFIGLVLSGLTAVGLIGTAATLYRLFLPHGPALTVVGAFGLLAAGVLLLVTGATGRSLHDLAGEWRATGGVAGDTIWTAARAVALIYEALAIVSFMLILASLAVFGVLILQRGVLPRWLGGLAVLGGLGVVFGLGLAWAAEWVVWAFFGGLVAGLTWCLITGGWLLVRGTASAPRPDPA